MEKRLMLFSTPSNSRYGNAANSVMRFLAVLLIVLKAGAALAQFRLEEPASDARVFAVTSQLNVKGQLEAAVADGKAVALKLKVDAHHGYHERRLSGAGRDARGLRSLRQYEKVEAEIEVSNRATSVRLSRDRRRIVAEGHRDGVMYYCPQGRLTYDELELLRTPGDSLAMLSLLPPKSVSMGEKWNCESWAVQMLTGTEAAIKGDLECKLTSVKADIATVTFEGEIEGATWGASATVKVSGRFHFDLKKSFIKRFELEQTEKRSVGPVSPGIDVVANVVIERRLATDDGALNDAAVEKIPLEPEPSLTWLSFRSPWNVKFLYARDWHIFHQSAQVAVLRLLDKGSLIAQCNVTKIAAADAGKHTPETQFRNDIRRSLGSQLKEITKAELLKNPNQKFRYRVTAKGEANGISMTWIYYLCANSSGRQVSFVFAVETKLLERLANRDLSIVNSLEFLTPSAPPKAVKPR